MAAGAHFLSDVIWSAPLQGPTGVNPPRWGRALGVAAPLAGVAVLLALYVLPHGSDLTGSVNVTLVLVDAPSSRVSVEGVSSGRGTCSSSSTPPGARCGVLHEESA